MVDQGDWDDGAASDIVAGVGPSDDGGFASCPDRGFLTIWRGEINVLYKAEAWEQ